MSENMCPFCGSSGLSYVYDSTGTTVECLNGCHGDFTFPASISEVQQMLRRSLNAKRGILLGRIYTKTTDAFADYKGKGHACPYRKALESIRDSIERHVDDITAAPVAGQGQEGEG